MEKLKLQMEILPSGAFKNNLRSAFSKKAWDFIRKDAYSRANGKCSICNRQSKVLDAHEKWQFDRETHTQKLVDVIGVCKSCHNVIHIARTQVLGFEDSAIKHFKYVNKCDYQGYIKELKRATDYANSLNDIDDWALDLKWLNRFIEEK